MLQKTPIYVAVFAFLAGCGGGGGGNSSSPTPVVAPPQNTAPTLSAIGSQSIVEKETQVLTVSATDADGDSLTFSLGGADASYFALDENGVLSFITAPDFEAPVDQNTDNVYTIAISVSDGQSSDSEEFGVTVLEDTDEDGVANVDDDDDDGDGVLDANDAFPLDASESEDTDTDGVGNNADDDDDGDGVLDVDDVFPLDASESVDTDGDGIGNNADDDDDGDGVLDIDDAYPLDSGRSLAGVDADAPTIARAEFGERPVLYVLVDFLDYQVELSDQQHLDRMFYENFSVADYYSRLFKNRIQIVAAPESYQNEGDGLVRVTVDENHPDDIEASDTLFQMLVSTAAQLEDFLDAAALDVDDNGVLTSDELTIAFVVAGQDWCRDSCSHNLPQVRGFTRFSFGDANGGLVMDGIQVPNIAIQPERGEFNDQTALSVLVHELGHAVFGVSDHYGETAAGEFVNYLGPWCQFSQSRLLRASDGVSGPQYMSGYAKLETNLVRALDVSGQDSEISVDSASTSEITDDRLDSSLARVWLDPYGVRESVLLEYRDTQGYDSFLANSGAIITRTQSLAVGSNVASEYRRAVLVGGQGSNGAQSDGEVQVLDAQDDTFGYAPNPTYAPSSLTLTYRGTDDGKAQFDSQLDQYSPPSGHLRYDLYSGDEDNYFVRQFYAGYADWQDPVFAGTVYSNSTDFDVIDGLEVHTRGDAVVTLSFYKDVLEDGTPFDLISEESFTVEGKGWHRLYLQFPVEFRPNDRLFVVSGISDYGEEYPLSMVKHANEIPNNATFMSSSGLTFFRTDDRLWRKILLLSRNTD